MGIFDIFKKKEQVNLADTVPQKPENQKGMSKQKILDCIMNGGGDCDHCESLHKCLKQKRQLRKIGMIKWG